MNNPTGRVLVVDDDSNIQWLLKENLKTTVKCSAVCVGSVTEAYQHLREERFDLIICDFQMNGETGANLLERLIADEIRLPFILYTGNPTIRRDSFPHLDYAFTVIQKTDLDDLMVQVSGALSSRKIAVQTREGP